MANKKKSNFPVITIILFVILVVVFSTTKSNDKPEDKTTAPTIIAQDGYNLTVHYLDVGQGDSEFIILPDGKTMLIDASTAEYGDDIVESIEGYGYSSLDYLVATHPDSDHIGGMTEVVESLAIGEIYMPRCTKTTNTYEKLLTSISDHNYSINTAKAGKSICTSSDYTIELLAPVGDEYEDANNYSAVVKITFGSKSFLFMGDAEKLAENEMLDTEYSKLDADVLKVGHHGSHSSSTIDFLNAVTPTYAVISCGWDNSYGHPHQETLSKLASLGVEVYRTDLDGTITFVCDGNNIEVTTKK